MYVVYAVQIVVHPGKKLRGSELCGDIVKLASNWLEEHADRHRIEPAESSTHGFGTWSDPAQRAEIVIEPAGDGTRFTTRSFDSEPIATAKLPRVAKLVLALLNRYPGKCEVGGVMVSGKVEVAPTNLRSIVDVLVQENRRIPILLQSQPVRHQFSAFAERLPGLAKYYLLPTEESSTTLQTMMSGSHLIPRGGDVRICKPGFHPEDPTFMHPIWSANDLSHPERSATLFRQFGDMLCEHSVQEFGQSDAFWETAHALDHEEPEVQESPVDLLAIRNLERLNEHLTNEVQDLTQEIDQLKRRPVLTPDEMSAALIAEEHARNTDLNLELENQAEMLERAYREIDALKTQRHSQLAASARQVSDEKIRLLSAGMTLTDLRSVVDFIEQDSSTDYLLIHQQAKQSASRYEFHGSLDAFLETMIHIRQAAEIFHTSSIAGHRELFLELGESNFKPTISDTAQKQYLGDYERRITESGTSKKVLCDSHIGVSGATPGTSIHIYWHIDVQQRRYIIGHIGRHLKGARDT